jgi:DNA polymerase III delta subunit
MAENGVSVQNKFMKVKDLDEGLEILRQLCSRGTIVPILALVSKDEFELSELVTCAKTLLGQKEVRLVPISPRNLLSGAPSATLFEPKIVYLLEVPVRQKGSDKELEQFLEKGADFELIIPTSALTPTLAKKIEAFGGEILEIQEAKPWESEGRTARYITNQCKKEGLSITRDALTTLARAYCKDRFVLKSELQKLFAYVSGKKEITLTDCKDIVTLAAQAAPWLLCQAAVEGKTAEALRIAHDAFSQDMHPLTLQRYVRGELARYFLVASYMAKKVPEIDLQCYLPQLRGKTLETACRLVWGRPLSLFQEALIAVDDLEVELKNSQIDETLAFERLLYRLCSTFCRTS